MKDDFIKYAPLFAGLSDADRRILADGFEEGQCSANAVLLTAGERGESTYLIGEGFVGLSTHSGQNLATLGPGSILGEASLFRKTPLDVNATALSNLKFWKLTDANLREIILDKPAIGIQLSQNFGSLLAQMEDYLVQRLARTQELSNLPQHALQAVAARLQPRSVEAQEYLYRAGNPSAGLFLLEDGAVELHSEDASGGDRVKLLQPGTLFGSLALLTSKPYVQNAVVTRKSLLWVLSAEDFQAISTQQPGLRRSLARTARARLMKADQSQAVFRLAQMPLFSEIPPQTLQVIAEKMVLQHVPAGQRVYAMGEAGDALYLIENGEVELTAENANGVVEELARIDSAGFFGEMSLLTGQIRTEDATATRNTNLWILYKSDLDALSDQYPAIGKALSQGLASRLARHEEEFDAERFRKFQLFAELGSAELKQVVDRLQPTRYRATEQIYRSTSPADTLFLLEKGQVRIQPLSGGSWLLGPGEAFGERALLTNQPHNASAFAETDIDLWTLSKSDFDALLNQYPSLAINISRMLSERLAQVNTGATADGGGATTQTYGPAATPATNVPTRRRRVEPSDMETSPEPQNDGFGQWFANLSTFGKIRLAVLVLLIIWLLGIAAPAALLSLIQGTSVASGADLTTSRSNVLSAITAVYAVGSYELASKDQELAQALALADKQVPPTPTYTPAATVTPVPTSTPLPTNTPAPTATPSPTVQTRQFVQELIPQPVAPTPEPKVELAAGPARAWDPRLDRLGVNVEEAPVAPGQQYWRLVEARWQNEKEAGGKHHIYVEVLDENGNRVTGQPVTVYWGDGGHTAATEDKAPPDYAYNYQMYAAGNAYHVKVEGLPSDILHGAGMGDIERPNYGIHTNFLLTFQKTTKP